MTTVEVRLAYAFDCSACNRESFAASVLHEFSPDERVDVADQIGATPQTGEWVTHPDTVHCQHCGTEFHAINPGQTPEQ